MGGCLYFVAGVNSDRFVAHRPPPHRADRNLRCAFSAAFSC
jgi:hypothetical protein